MNTVYVQWHIAGVVVDEIYYYLQMCKKKLYKLYNKDDLLLEHPSKICIRSWNIFPIKIFSIQEIIVKRFRGQYPDDIFNRGQYWLVTQVYYCLFSTLTAQQCIFTCMVYIDYISNIFFHISTMLLTTPSNHFP